MRKLCDFLARNLEPVTYADEIEDEYDGMDEEEYEKSFVDPFQTLGTNGDERRITLPQPNGEISKPLKLDIGQVRFKTNTLISCFRITAIDFFSVYILRSFCTAVKIYLRNAGIDARMLSNDLYYVKNVNNM